MKKEQILRKAIKKAIENGWDSDFGHPDNWNYDELFECLWDFTNDDEARIEIHINRFIFSHDFAKAFWGEENHECDNCRCYIEGSCDCKEMYLYHLQQLALSKDRIKYLEKFT